MKTYRIEYVVTQVRLALVDAPSQEAAMEEVRKYWAQQSNDEVMQESVLLVNVDQE